MCMRLGHYGDHLARHLEDVTTLVCHKVILCFHLSSQELLEVSSASGNSLFVCDEAASIGSSPCEFKMLVLSFPHFMNSDADGHVVL